MRLLPLWSLNGFVFGCPESRIPASIRPRFAIIGDHPAFQSFHSLCVTTQRWKNETSPLCMRCRTASVTFFIKRPNLIPCQEKMKFIFRLRGPWCDGYFYLLFPWSRGLLSHQHWPIRCRLWNKHAGWLSGYLSGLPPLRAGVQFWPRPACGLSFSRS